MTLSITNRPAPAWLTELAHGRATYEELLGWPVSVQVGDRLLIVAIGQAVTLRLIITHSPEAVSVPRAAIVDDAGQPIVFVQAGGESFERRPVRVRFEQPAGTSWRVATQLIPAGDAFTYSAPNLQYLMDSPTEFSAFVLRTFTVTDQGRTPVFRVALHHTGSDDDVRAWLGGLNVRELVILLPIAVLILWMGMYSDPFLRKMDASLQKVVDRIEQVIEKARPNLQRDHGDIELVVAHAQFPAQRAAAFRRHVIGRCAARTFAFDDGEFTPALRSGGAGGGGRRRSLTNERT